MEGSLDRLSNSEIEAIAGLFRTKPRFDEVTSMAGVQTRGKLWLFDLYLRLENDFACVWLRSIDSNGLDTQVSFRCHNVSIQPMDDFHVLCMYESLDSTSQLRAMIVVDDCGEIRKLRCSTGFPLGVIPQI